MIGCIYKIIAKLLAVRLKDVIGCLINESQTTFIGGRQILDGIFVANQTIEWLKKKRKNVVLLKLDFQKAYDSEMELS